MPDRREFGMGQNGFDQCLAKAKSARSRLDEDIAEMGAKGVVGEQPAETDLRSVSARDRPTAQ